VTHLANLYENMFIQIMHANTSYENMYEKKRLGIVFRCQYIEFINSSPYAKKLSSGFVCNGQQQCIPIVYFEIGSMLFFMRGKTTIMMLD